MIYNWKKFIEAYKWFRFRTRGESYAMMGDKFPNIDDYVVSSKPILNRSNLVGRITFITGTNKEELNYSISYEFLGNRASKIKNQVIKYGDIEFWSVDEEDCKSYIESKKYNL